MKLEELAVLVVETIEAANVDFMIVGAIAAGAYGIPRSTRDVDFLIELNSGDGLPAVISKLEQWVEFDPQVVFDTLTWGRRQVGLSRSQPPFKVEFFELFDDPFVQSEFSRRQRIFIPILNCKAWLPTPEDVVVQKLRWGRNKDLDDARDVLAVQEPENLDMDYIRRWCAEHETSGRLDAALAEIPPM